MQIRMGTLYSVDTLYPGHATIYTVKPLDSEHYRSPKFCSIFKGVRYSEGINF